MTPRLYDKDQAAEDLGHREERDRSRIVHHVGPAATGLFPGWGPKL